MARRPKTEAAFETEMDANALAEAAAIRADRGRMSKAKVAAARMASEQQVKATAMKRIARKPAKSSLKTQTKRRRT